MERFQQGLLDTDANTSMSQTLIAYGPLAVGIAVSCCLFLMAKKWLFQGARGR